ncbi:sodium channel protein type 9 subunit alpha isoform X5 [Hydra vulgaris]|uniref:Sodium channel protein type 9 subunit alpha isoform X5 n=1 Tax=Hydra vulgaris TaxID=6087 RepID=A0ABM4CK76_HYDVU
MFYYFVKASKEKESELFAEKLGIEDVDQDVIDERNAGSSINMEPGLFGRKFIESKIYNNNGSNYPNEQSKDNDETVFFDLTEANQENGKELAHDKEIENLGGFNYVPKCMLGKPLKDFDSGDDNTFLVINNKLGRQTVFRFCKEKSLFLFGTDSLVRRINIYILTHQYFEVFILLTIVTNCVFMALSHPPQLSEYVFAAIYTIEMFIKILAKGFILHKYAYLRNSWNWLDFVVVVIGYVTLHPQINNLDSIRTFRVLRALKTISTVKGLKAMVNTLLKSVKMMADVLILTLFFIAVLALIGLQLFLGSLRSRCVRNDPNNTMAIFSKEWQNVPENMLTHICGNASSAWTCEEGWTCVPDVAPNNDKYVNYDNFFYAMLTSMQVCTLDYWEVVFNSVIAAKGEFYMVYFMLCIFLGPFYLLNLVLAVVSASYEMEVNSHPDEAVEKEKIAAIQRSSSTYSFHGKNCVEFLSGPSPVKDVDGVLFYTIENSPPKKKKKKTKVVILPPELSSNPNFYNKVRVLFYKIVSHSLFEGFITACIMLNTLLMALEHHNMSAKLTKITEIFNYVFTGIFIFEMMIKLVGYTPRGYVQNKWNLFDGVLVILSVIDILLLIFTTLPKGTLKMLKVFRLMRILKLAQSWKTMGQLISTIASSMGALVNVTVILGLIIYIFSVVGMQLFKRYYDFESYKDKEDFPRYNFSNFGSSFIMIFRILCGKWIEPQWALLEKTYFSIFFVFAVFVIGRWVVLNLFLALLLSSFGGDALSGNDSSDECKKKKRSRLKMLIEWVKQSRSKPKMFKDYKPEVQQDSKLCGEIQLLKEDSTDIIHESLNHHDESSMLLVHNGSSNFLSKRKSETETESERLDTKKNFIPDNYKREFSSSSIKIEIQREKTYVDDCFCDACYNASCCVTSYLNSPIRQLWHNARFKCQVLIEHKYFEAVVLFLICVSSITLVFEDVYLPSRPTLKTFLQYCNYFFAFIFTLEFLIKLFALGFIKYFTNFWNLLDVFIVTISLASLFGSQNLKVLRSLRGLRPLRAISRFQGMKIVVNALISSIPSIANVLLVCMVFWLIFSIMGYNLFGGKFYYCANSTDQNTRLKVNFGIKNKLQCKNHSDFVWVKKNINFDSSIDGFLALFQTATLEGWFEVMADAYDAKSEDEQPVYRNNYANQIFFVVFIVLGAFFILNLFIGVIIDNFNRLKQQYEDGVGVLLTPGQRNWVNTLKAASLKKPSRRLTRPTSKWRAALFDFIQAKYFEFFIMSVILLNMVTMMLQHHHQSLEFDLALIYLNYLFTGIFTLEAIVRLIAMRLEYFKYGLNIFDFIIVCLSIAVIIIEEIKEDNNILPGFGVIRVCRFYRLFQFLPIVKGIKKLLFILIKSGPALFNVGILFILITFIYAVIAMNLFSNLKLQGSLTKVVNFRTFASSFSLMFRIATAAGWNNILEAAMVQHPSCYKNLEKGGFAKRDCENFNQIVLQNDYKITDDDVETYYKSWENFDPEATQFISYYKLSDFLDSLDGPLRVAKPNYWFLEQSNIPIRDQFKCHCLDVIEALINFFLGESVCKNSEGITTFIKNFHSRCEKKFPLWAEKNTVEVTRQRLQKENASANLIQNAFRNYLLKNELRLINSIKSNHRKHRDETISDIERLQVAMWKATEYNEVMIEKSSNNENDFDEDYDTEKDDEVEDNSGSKEDNKNNSEFALWV